MAMFLIFLLAGSSATWALTPPPTRDWWLTSLRDSAEAYAEYQEKYRDDPRAQTRVEKATFFKAEKTGELAHLREYQQEYPQGQYRMQVLEKIETLELGAIASIRQQPEAEKIRQFVQNFPESERLPELRQAVGQRAELLPVVENAYVNSIQAQPTRAKVTAFLRDFPQSERLPEVTRAAKSQPEVLRQVQPELEDVYLEKLEAAPTEPAVENFLQTFPVPARRERFERVLDKKPNLKQRFLEKINKAEAEQKAREAAERQRREQEAAEKARLEELQRKAREAKDAEERQRLEKEAERLRLQQEEEAKRDSDGDGVPDKNDKCPEEKGEPANDGCPALNQPETNPNDATPPEGGAGGAFDMVTIPGGTFTMGCQDGRDKDCYGSEKPAHTVTLSSFQIGKYEVTQAQWRAVMGSDPPELHNKGCDQCPVEGVSWNDIQEFLKKLNAQTGKRYRLPTEAEWEYAARGGAKSRGYLYAGSNSIGEVAWYGDNYETANTYGAEKTTHPVGQKKPNELGLYDMSGNVWEWCSDWYGDYSAAEQRNPNGPASGSSRVLRGGSWSNNPQDCRVANRYYYAPGNRFFNIGFRLARTN